MHGPAPPHVLDNCQPVPDVNCRLQSASKCTMGEKSAQWQVLCSCWQVLNTLPVPLHLLDNYYVCFTCLMKSDWFHWGNSTWCISSFLDTKYKLNHLHVTYDANLSRKTTHQEVNCKLKLLEDGNEIVSRWWTCTHYQHSICSQQRTIWQLRMHCNLKAVRCRASRSELIFIRYGMLTFEPSHLMGLWRVFTRK